MVNIKTLLPDLKELVGELAEDLLARATENADIDAGLREAFKQIEKGGRTAQAYDVWREDYLDQVAVAWVLACVFVRFMEDNHLIDECWLAGEKERRKLAEDSHEIFFRKHPHDTDREYFQHVFHQVGKIPAAKDIFAEGKTPLWAVAPSGDAARKLLVFWREMEPESGVLMRSFEVKEGDTRFLGDLYQDLSERARKKYALLQTPVFVEEFILDRTLNPAIDDFGLDKVLMIDATCGSGHFLLGGFARVFDHWIKRENNEIVAAQKALDGVWGVDINPFAVAIARFRLIVAALQACGIKRLKQAPAWKIHLATGDSLLFGSRWTRTGEKVIEQGWLASDEESWAPEIYACEDKEAIQEVLCQQYHAVVGNPPYIIVRDRTLNTAYRERYSTCHQKYSLAVPFAERFFDLCVTDGNGKSGYVGMITANSFMKREFGKKLIEEFFPTIDLTHVIDTSGAYIPGHGTPTAILFGGNRKPNGEAVRAVLGIKGEPSTPKDASKGFVWQSIVKQIDRAKTQDNFVSTADVPRTTFNSHPWSIGGGGVAELKEQLEDANTVILGDKVRSIGFASFPGLDDAFLMDRRALERKHIDHQLIKHFITGEAVRDWQVGQELSALVPYDSQHKLLKLDKPDSWARHLWTVRTCLENVVSFAHQTRKELGEEWWGWYRWVPEKYRTPCSISFASVATYNHFVFDRGGKVFNRHAPVVKLSEAATEDDHLELLGLLNSSSACFWMKQTFHNKGSTVDQHGARQRTAPFEDFYEFACTGLESLPVPEQKPTELARQLEKFGQMHPQLLPDATVQTAIPNAARLEDAKKKAARIRRRMIALQEELDWQCYQLYGLVPDDLRIKGDDLPEIAFGHRAFEIVMARQMDKGELETTWFERHGSKPITDVPSHWPSAYKKLVERRIKTIETNKEIALIERPEYKRRWNDEPWEEQEQRALRNSLLDRLESTRYWPDAKKKEPALQSAAQLADKASGDHEFMQVAALYRGRPDFDLTALVAELVTSEAVPFLPVLRFKPSGLRKRAVWEQTWELQRQQDAGEDVGDIPVPPKYTTGDFQKTDYWRLRGKLDVPKERWISYPHCSTDSDLTLLIGWAGWNNLQQATALVHYYDARKREGWDARRLTPLLAGLDQLLPWIHQWHPEIDKEFGETAGQSFQTMLEHDAHELGLTLEDIRDWQPHQTTTRQRQARK
jgi:hypothetical protein